MIVDGQAWLRRAGFAYLAHDQGARKLQALGNRLAIEKIGGQSGSVRKRERLGGTLNYYFASPAEIFDRIFGHCGVTNRGRNKDGNHAVCDA